MHNVVCERYTVLENLAIAPVQKLEIVTVKVKSEKKSWKS